MQRTTISETTKKIGEEVLVKGWAQKIRSHGQLLFLDLRDRSGLAQVVFDSKNKKAYQKALELRPEWVIEITGKVKERPKNMQNEKIETGRIEIEAKELTVFSQAKTPPFEITEDTRKINEEKRMAYRYLDLRSQRMKNNLLVRHKVIKFIRDFMTENGFWEIETPLLTKSTPEGARDYVVPSRIQPGKFYALPQSPQQYKQLLMVAGFEKYFQIVKCLRDEDPRGDRQPEFTQLDIEMSFVKQEDLLNLIEKLYTQLVKKLFPIKQIQTSPFPRLTYKEAETKYQTDRPDLRKNKQNPDELAFCFVLDFPMFEKSAGKDKWTAMHHPFTRPQVKSAKELTKENMDKLLAFQYDLVLNGQEIAGGSIRTHEPAILEKVFELLGHQKQEINEKFGHLLEAFQYGAPPHGGIASGLDRALAILQEEESIREVIAFPKTGDGRDLMMQAPAEISQEQLKELGIQIKK